MQHIEGKKYRGAWDVIRTIPLPGLERQPDAEVAAAALNGLEGVYEVQADLHRRCLSVAYDLTLVDYRTIVTALAASGYPPRNSWWMGVRARWYQYLDSNGRDNAHAPAPPCCSNPRGIAGRMKK